ncbi:paerucumarin biosynthesis protein PvcA [Longispora fulva]|uniref:Pyoverdine/dityrosine biosynthesis protein Dit1 n=1 Tax=Longispora fulva TaxID=619741 RepID=A0A8J7G7T5_9ACTN|nr:isocyanide synthase family protein [Longispora fulva]MBG6134675.1 pyoverdine/dityrosine biosynthesis protein Dit1 [Longispora fulva]GIG61883.1 paerucumarin biosynthesis protein PvcA [Longispora fulva]
MLPKNGSSSITFGTPPSIGPKRAGHTDEIAERVLRWVFRYRRLAEPEDPCATVPCERCFDIHRPTVAAFVAAGRPIHFVLPAFPAKSPNPGKVLGTLPDLAERLAVEFLQSMCEHIGRFHEPGASITICSDGHVFADLVGVSDLDVSAYGAELKKVIAATGGGAIDTYSLDDVFGRQPYDQSRALLDRDWATPLPELRERVRRDPTWTTLFNGIHRFVFEDAAALNPDQSRTKLRDAAKDVAYGVIARSNAWSRIVESAFPGAVRLSIHPQPVHSPKIGLHLVPTRDAWLTPWHGTALHDGNGLALVKRAEAESLAAQMVWRHNRPSHFVAASAPHRR